ncbi:hypothetical protein [Actinokineospora globicatena]|uniref:hypothetical protein n=1 Tax=Actinokineospora globicatena TaxID=103729 RepID=UPI0020A3BE3F|nr:hypothetical protein [Actinokineospora globicatena]GLW75928.1 hypothetical protein Aglo01_04100 [Actinokineospora globicatena]GLW82768.1 hypothetical protein Aglo02_04080 [Actinokineospora globicatena]
MVRLPRPCRASPATRHLCGHPVSRAASLHRDLAHPGKAAALRPKDRARREPVSGKGTAHRTLVDRAQRPVRRSRTAPSPTSAHTVHQGRASRNGVSRDLGTAYPSRAHQANARGRQQAYRPSRACRGTSAP